MIDRVIRDLIQADAISIDLDVEVPTERDEILQSTYTVELEEMLNEKRPARLTVRTRFNVLMPSPGSM